MTHHASASQGVLKLFVCDTNVLMHDPTSILRFKEHDVFIPMITLEELDDNKKGHSEVARNARMAGRLLDELTADYTGKLAHGVPLATYSHGEATGSLFLETEYIGSGTLHLPNGKADNRILAVVQYLCEHRTDRRVILVSKDINMRIKARALGFEVEDYLSDQVVEDANMLPTGIHFLPDDFWEEHAHILDSGKEGGRAWYNLETKLAPSWHVNDFLAYDDDSGPFDARVRKVEGKRAQVETVLDYRLPKHTVWGINARNREQEYALNLLMDPDMDCVTLLGQAGTGKTLLTIAAGLQQTLERPTRYSDIVFSRITIPVGEDIGFLPGDEEEKMNPWMGALDDNLEVLMGYRPGNRKFGESNTEFEHRATLEQIRRRIQVRSLNFMRGRTFLEKFVVIDEAQNLTPKQMKTLITRAGPGTKMVIMGNLAQIDTPYLTEGSSGLAYLVDRMRGWPHAGHVTLLKGERSRLADHATEVL